jgi:ubiquinone/menaquinone biosynthesis C-methylase UbiE
MKLKGNIAEEFDEFSRNYTEDMVGCVPHYKQLLNDFTAQLPSDFEPSQILDLGSGNGNVVHTLLNVFPEANYTLVDASQEMLNLCQTYFEKYTMSYRNSYFNDFDFEPNSYDLVTAGFSLHHCFSEDKQNVYTHIFKALKNGGIFSCSDLMINKQDEEHKSHLKRWEAFVSNAFPDGEKWSWLMNHYDQFDHPDRMSDHLHFLHNAGFKRVTCNVYSNYWSHFKAYKDS